MYSMYHLTRTLPSQNALVETYLVGLTFGFGRYSDGP